jgi:hypothetical protein
VFVDALNPSRAFQVKEIEPTVRKLVAGLKAYGVRDGDCLCVHAHNDVSFDSCSCSPRPAYFSTEATVLRGVFKEARKVG